VSLRAPDFDREPAVDGIEKPMRLDQSLECCWGISPKSTGTKLLAVEIATKDGETPALDKWTVDRKQEGFDRVSAGSVEFPVDVRSSLGLTRYQEDLLKAIAAIVAVLGTVLAYPIWSALTRPSKSPTSA